MSFTANNKIWELFCLTDGWVETGEINGIPTDCPIESNHTVNIESIHIIQEHTPVNFVLDDKKDIVLQQQGNVLTHYYGHRTNEIHISKDTQSDYTSIASAVAAHQEPSMIFIVHPGTYIEMNPITIPYGSTIKSAGNAANTIVIGAIPNQPVFILSLMADIYSLTIVGAVAPGGCAIYFDGAGAGGQFSMIHLCLLVDCYYGIHAVNGNNKLVVLNTVIANQNYQIQRGICLENGADCNTTNVILAGNPANRMPIGIHVANSRIHMVVTGIQYPDVGIHCNDSGECNISECYITQPNIGVCIGNINSESTIIANTIDIRSSIEYDIKIYADDAQISINAGKLHSNKIYNPNGVKINASFYAVEQGKKFTINTGDIRFGDVNEPSKLQVGEGKYVLENICVFHNDEFETGTWADYSEAANSYDGSVFELYPDDTANSCVYIGSEHKIVGFKSLVVTDGQVNNVTDVIWEYSTTGNNWVEASYMSTDASEPYFSYNKQFFEIDSKHHVRFGITKLAPMEKRILNGETKYWMRSRIINDIVSNPELEYIKLHASSSKMNSDGWLEYFGDARPVERLPWSINLTSPANSSPGNRDLYLGDNLGVGRIENYFQNNAVDRLGLNSYLPQNIDTSFPLKLKWSFTGSSNSANNIRWIVRWGFSQDNDTVHDTTSSSPTIAPNEKNLEVITAVPGSSADKQLSESAKLDITFCIPRPETGNPDIIWITLERTGNHGSDTYTGHAGIIQLNVEYIKWCEGGHLHSY